jgi:DNA modification methylase
MVNKIINKSCLDGMAEIKDNSVDCCITSPPYWGLRDYGNDNQLGLEETPEKYVENMVNVFRGVKRVLKEDGTLWLNLGDAYWGGGWRGSGLNSNSGDIQKAHIGTHVGEIMVMGKGRHELYKAKDLVGIPWMVAFALRADGWYLRQDIIWHKPNPMPESVTDRCTKSHEYIFLLSKSKNYYFDYESIQEEATGYDGRKDTLLKGSDKYKQRVVTGKKEHTFASRGHERWKFKTKSTFGNRDGKMDKLHSGNQWEQNLKKGNDGELYPVRNKRSVWTVNTKPYKEAHFAVYPEKLIVGCIKAGCPEGGIVLDPFMGSGTTAVVARKLGRNYIGYELNSEYIKLAEKRIREELGMFA